MNDEFWKQFPTIPGFDCVEMKHRAQLRINEETQGMTDEELIKYYNRTGRAFRETGKIPTATDQIAVLREDPSNQ